MSRVEALLILLYVFDLCDSSKKLHLLGLYHCVEEFEEYCHGIPQLTVQAAAEVANNCPDLLPDYTIHISTINITRSVSSSGEVRSYNVRLLQSCVY